MLRVNLENPLSILFTLTVFFFFLANCKGQDKMSMDEYEFYLPQNIEKASGKGDENVLFALSDPKGITIIVQNKINLLKDTFFEDLNSEEALTSMHRLKFSSYIELFDGYDVESVKLAKIGQVLFSIQTFRHMYEEVEIGYDLRIIQIRDDYYAFYSFDKAEKLEQTKNSIDQIIRSLSTVNLE